MRNQNIFLTADNLSTRLSSLENVLPYMFILNKQYYTRYGSLYVNTLGNLDLYMLVELI